MNKENVLRVAATLAQLCDKNLKKHRANSDDDALKIAAWCDNGAQLLSRLAING
jgi:hypothetical protein